MSRRLPDCAFCGGTLKRGPTVRLVFTCLPGRPEVGWHLGPDDPWRCGWPGHDPLASMLVRRESDGQRGAATTDEILWQLREIEARGARRLSVNREWHEREREIVRAMKVAVERSR